MAFFLPTEDTLEAAGGLCLEYISSSLGEISIHVADFSQHQTIIRDIENEHSFTRKKLSWFSLGKCFRLGPGIASLSDNPNHR